LAARKGLDAIAITDHDSVGGVEDAMLEARSFPSLEVIPGVELNTDIANGEVHILGYFIDCQSQELEQTLNSLRQSRSRRARQMIDKLVKLGIHVEWERVRQLAGDGSIGRPHIAQVILEQGYIDSIQEAFNKYIGRRGPAYVERERLTPVAAVELVVRAGGLPVLAHPASLSHLKELLGRLKPAGLVGLEAYYNGYSQKTIDLLVDIANQHGLITSGGSDFHGLGDDNETSVGDVYVPAAGVEQLLALAAGPQVK
jgi:predicted metal-dependent phosphoesterase TrpH